MFSKRIFALNLIMALASTLLATTWHISVDGSDDTGDGSEGFPFASIQFGIDTTQNSDTVLVQPGTYFENINFNGKNVVVSSLELTTGDTSYISSTIIDGGANASVVTINSGETNACELNGLTITNGNSWYGDDLNNGLGGGICIADYSAPILKHLRVVNNLAAIDGGGLSIKNYSTPILEDLLIENNQSIQDGGGIYIELSSPIIRNSIIRGNSGCGIAIITISSPFIEDCIVSENFDDWCGAGIKIAGAGGTTNIVRTLICDNIATHYGGGLFASGTMANPSLVNLVNVTIANNETSVSGGGGILGAMEAELNVVNTIVWGNQPDQIFQDHASSIINVDYSDIQGGYTGEANLDSDPLFEGLPGSLYHLIASSPCVDAGNPDLDGDSDTWETDPDDQDPDGTQMDMGVYYYHQTYFGPTWHVSTEGSDSLGDGSNENPFYSLQRGINRAAQNDTISIGSGLFTDDISIQNKSLVLLGVDSSNTILSADEILIQSTTSHDVTVKNLKFLTNDAADDLILGVGCPDCLAGDTLVLTLDAIAVEGNHEQRFLQEAQNTMLNISHSRFQNLQAASGDGAVLDLRQATATISHSLFTGNSATGNGQTIYAGEHSSIAIDFTTFSNNGSAAGSIAIADSANLNLSNSILWGNPNFQIIVLAGGDPCTLSIDYTNIANGQFGIDDQSSTLNLVWGPGNLNILPEFVSENNLTLQPSSPCINAGNPDWDGDGDAWEIDVDDQDPDGTRLDLGAFYYDQRDVTPPEVTLNFPEITEEPQNGDTLQVTWVASDNIGLDWAKLWFSSDRGQSFILSDSIDANLGQVNWVAPDVISNSCKLAIWVSDLAGNVSADTLDATFPIDDSTLPTITVLTPIGSATIPEGDTLYVSWEAHDNVGIEWFDLFYYNDPSSMETSSFFNIPASERSFAFEIPMPGVSDSAQIRIEVQDLAANTNCAYSDYFTITDNTSPIIAYFSILDTLNFGIGSRMDIMVAASDNVEITGLDLNYSVDDGATWIAIVQGLYPIWGRPTYSWLIPDIPGPCQIQAIVTDAVGLTDSSYSGLFNIVVEYPRLVAHLPQIRPSDDLRLRFSQVMDDSLGLSLGTQVTGSVGGSYEIKGSFDGHDIIISSQAGFVALDTLRLVLSATEWANVFGYGLDGNGNGVYDGSPLDNDTAFTIVSAAGDYDQNGLLDFDDFSVFVIVWNNNITKYELAPHSGELPFISIQPDSSFDIFDLATFASMWNWSVGINPVSPQIGAYDIVDFAATQDGNHLSVDLGIDDYMAAQTIVKYDPHIVSVSVADPGLAKVSLNSMVLVDANPDSGYITITSSRLSGEIEDQLQLLLTPKTRQKYSIEIAVQGSDEDRNVTQKRSVVDLIPIPTTYSLSQNYPNPFNSSTTLEYGLPKRSELNISIFDIRGRYLKEIYSGHQQSGYYSIQWDGTDEFGQGLASGLYFIVLNTPEHQVARKALILK